MVALVDTNLLVYRFDSRSPEKQQIATEVLRDGIEHDTIRVPHQAIVEFVAAVSSIRLPDGSSLLPVEDACREAEELLAQFQVIYPSEPVIRMALRSAVAYKISWFDAHIWAYAEHYGLDEILSEDFQHGRLYGTVRARNPFLTT